MGLDGMPGEKSFGYLPVADLCAADRLFSLHLCVAADVVDDDNIARLKGGRTTTLLDIGQKRGPRH